MVRTRRYYTHIYICVCVCVYKHTFYIRVRLMSQCYFRFCYIEPSVNQRHPFRPPSRYWIITDETEACSETQNFRSRKPARRPPYDGDRRGIVFIVHVEWTDFYFRKKIDFLRDNLVRSPPTFTICSPRRIK